MMFAFTAVSAIVPSFLLAWYFHSRDVYPEPQRVIWATFGLGVLSTIPVLLVAWPTQFAVESWIENIYMSAASDAFLVAAVPEEFFKFLVLYLYAARHPAFDEPMDGIVYGAIASLGFATLENVLYTLQGGLAVAVLRAFTAVPGHAFCGAIMGYFVGQARFNPRGRRGSLMVQALAWPMLLHGLYDFPLMAMQKMQKTGVEFTEARTSEAVALSAMTLAVLIFEWVWAVRLTRRLRKDQKAQALAEAAAPAPAAEPTPIPSAPSEAGTAVDSTAAKAVRRSKPPARPVLSRVLMILGALLSSGGGLVLLGVGLALATGHTKSEELPDLLLGTAILGLLPLVAGVVLFIKGLRRLPKRQRPASGVYRAVEPSVPGPQRPSEG